MSAGIDGNPFTIEFGEAFSNIPILMGTGGGITQNGDNSLKDMWNHVSFLVK